MTALRKLTDITNEELDSLLSALHERGVGAETLAIWEKAKSLSEDARSYSEQNEVEITTEEFVQGWVVCSLEDPRDGILDYWTDVVEAAKKTGVLPDSFSL